MNNPSIIKQRLSEFAYAIGKNKRQFTKDIGVSESFLVSKGGITEEKIINIISIFPQLNANWLLTGKGSMLLPESENLSENKSNLAKQRENTPRLITHQDVQKLLTKQKEEFMSELSEIFGKFTDTLNKQIETNNKQIEANNNQIERSFTLMMEQMKLMHSMIGRVEEKTNKVIDMNRKAM